MAEMHAYDMELALQYSLRVASAPVTASTIG